MPTRPDALPDRLLALLRPRFTDQVIVPDADDPVLGGGRCAVTGCDRLVQGRGLCGSRYSRWRKSGRLDLVAFVSTTAPLAARCGLRPTQCYDLRGLPRGLRLEVAYALQCRLDERRAGLRPVQVARAVKVLAASGASSLLDRSLRYWLANTGQRPSGRAGGVRHTEAGAFLPYAYQRVADLARAAATTSTTATRGTLAGWVAGHRRQLPDPLWRHGTTLAAGSGQALGPAPAGQRQGDRHCGRRRPRVDVVRSVCRRGLPGRQG